MLVLVGPLGHGVNRKKNNRIKTPLKSYSALGELIFFPGTIRKPKPR
jgi:hypothetical protein